MMARFVSLAAVFIIESVSTRKKVQSSIPELLRGNFEMEVHQLIKFILDKEKAVCYVNLNNLYTSTVLRNLSKKGTADWTFLLFTE
jgi:hypothetical protein